MAPLISLARLKLLFFQLRERLWVRPLLMCIISVLAVLAAQYADSTSLVRYTPDIALDSIETLLTVLATGMLAIATFSVGSMVSAYVSASNTATPRSFSLVVSDDVSQNALSTFVGAFIFSVVAITAVKNDFFQETGLFFLFLMILLVYVLVVLTFVRWVDRIARLGLLGSTIAKAEKATAAALYRRRKAPTLCGQKASSPEGGHSIYADNVGYVQQIDMEALQNCAEQHDLRINVVALPGTFATPARALATILDARDGDNEHVANVSRAFSIGNDRLFDDDPRFGLIVLSEIAGRALSPGINDPGTAIDITGTLVRLFSDWGKPVNADELDEVMYDRITVPELDACDMFDDAFTAIARDGAGHVEVAIRLQKALHVLSLSSNPNVRDAARRHARQALERARLALRLPADLLAVEAVASLTLD
ncbi:MAG: DUF2254 domain-containing protein [Pseudohongiella sp.]|uniref:DUF2254 domain-containing protein n=1 Tax=Pseudohongiella sp. TaxID=1979412 RepID=UPI0034A03314